MGNRFVRTALAAGLCALALALQPTAPAAGQTVNVDLSTRRALYFTGAKAGAIDLKNDRYVAAGGTMTLQKSQASKCDASGCEFNLGFIAFRAPAAAALSTYGLIQVEGGGLVGNTVQFADKVGTRQHVLPVRLTEGTHKLAVTVDPYGKTAESDEGNNSFTVTVIVRG